MLAAAVSLRAETAVETQEHAASGGVAYEHAAPPAAFNGRIALYKTAMGPFKRQIASRNSEAQAFFNQGFQLTYAFARPEAVRSFREARTRDPECAICYWGEAWAWGSDLNWTMSAEEAPHAYTAIQKAIVAGTCPRDADRAGAHSGDGGPVRRALRSGAPRRSGSRLCRRDEDGRRTPYPDDLDAATMYAAALFLLEPRSGPRDIANPNVQRILGVLERALAKDLRHPGACHLYIHLTEATSEPGRATACAEFLGPSIPGASHINHMPSHTWTQVGRWGDAVRASLDAWHSDLKSLVGEGIAIYPWHDLHMLIFAASMDGQGAMAVQAGRDY